MKRILSLLLALTLVFALVACSNDKDITSKPDTSTTTQTETKNTDTNDTQTSETDTDESSSDTETPSNSVPSTNIETNKPTTNLKDNNSEIAPPQNISKPTHTHTFSVATCTEPKKCSCGTTEGTALGHKWQEATCKAPKTCSFCKITEGDVSEHIYETVKCKMCEKPLEKISTLSWGLVEKVDYVTRYTIIDFKNNIFGCLGYDTRFEEGLYTIKINGVTHKISFGDFNDSTVSIQNNVKYENEEYLLFYPYGNNVDAYIKLQRLNKTDLMIVENKDTEFYGFKPGKTLKLIELEIVVWY